MPLLRGPDGAVTFVSDDQVGHALDLGYTPASTTEAADQATAEDRGVSGLAGGALAAGSSFLSGLTLGGSDVAARALLSHGDVKDIAASRAEHPIISTGSQIAGAIAPAFVAPESLLAKTPAGLTARLGARIAEAGEGLGVAGRAAFSAAGAAGEGALQNAGSYVSDVALGDRDLSAEGFVGAMGKGALYGGVAGGALSMASNGLIAARKLIPLAEQTPEAALAAETTARRAVSDSVQTSKGLEATGANAVSQADRETQQFLQDLEAERAQALREFQPATPGQATSDLDAQLQAERMAQGRVADRTRQIREALANPDAPMPEGAPVAEAPSAPEASAPESAPTREPFQRGNAKQLLKDWRAKYPEGAVDYDAANAAARRGRLAKWAEGFEAKTPEDEAIKAYFQHDQDPIRVLDENGRPVRQGLPEDVPAAVKAVANRAAGDAAHQAYLEAVPKAADVSESGTELMARSMYAARREAARALDDVYTAYKAGQPIVDIRAAATQKLTGQLHELAEARNDLLQSLAKSPEADSLLEKLKATKQAVDETGKLPTLGEQILNGAPAPKTIDPDEAVAKALGKTKDVNEDIATIAPKITRYEAAKASLTESLGPKASADAQAHAAAFRAAQQKAEQASARQVAQATENIDKAADGAPLEKMVGGAKPALGGIMKTASNAGAAYEALREMGVPLPDPKGIPVIGPILSAYLKAKIIGKMMGKFGGSFAATAESTIAAKAAATRNRIAQAVDTMASASAKVSAAAAKAGGPAAALGHKLFESQDKQPKPYTSEPKIEPIEKMYQDRMAELTAAMQPGAIEQAVRSRVHTSDPTIVDAIVAAETRRLQYLYNQAPKPDAPPLPGQPARLPSKTEISQWGVTLAAAHDPAEVFERVAAGGVARPAEIDCVQNCYPQLVAEAQKTLIDRLSKASAAPSYMRRVAASALIGIPLDQSAIPENAAYLQSGFGKPAATAPQPMPSPTLTSNISLGQQSLTRLDR